MSKHCNDCVHFVFVSKCGDKPALNCEIVGYGTRAENLACDRFADIPDDAYLFQDWKLEVVGNDV